MKSADKLLRRALAGETLQRPPVWLMRQAGRYLPEYQRCRAEVGGFLDLCFTPDAAVEVTMQPIRRYGFDAAILFSDILVVPHALGQNVWFEDGKGPQLEPLKGPMDLPRLSRDGLHDKLAPVYQTLRQLAGELPAETTLIGFAGAPWTVASYMIEGGSSRDFALAKSWAYSQPESFAALIELLVETTTDYLAAQVDAGAEVLQIFDSWAGVWPEREFRLWCLQPITEIRRRLAALHPEIPVIAFPRGAGLLYRDFSLESGCEGLSLDTTLPLGWAREMLQPQATLQGNLDPLLLVSGGKALETAVRNILENLAAGPFIFNLGHGIVPQTPPENVARLVELVRA